MGVFDRLPPMDHMRSEKMCFVQLIMPAESSRLAITYLGELGLLQFKDLNEDKSPFQRIFVNQVKRCAEMSRKLRFFSDQINRAGVRSSVRPALEPDIDLEELEARLGEHEHELLEMNTNSDKLQQTYNELLEFKLVLSKAGGILASSHNHAASAERELDENIYDNGVDEGNAYLLEQGVHQGARGNSGVRFVSGIILKSKALAFERMLFRATRGNMLFNQAPAGEPVTDPISGEEVEKTVFVVFFSGEQAKAKILKICDSFGASCYPVPEEMVKQRHIFNEVSARLSDLEVTLDAGIQHRNKALESIGSQLWRWTIMVKKEKAVYDTLNMLNFDVTKKCLVGEGWCPIFAKSQIKDCLQRATLHSNSQVGTIFHEMDTIESPPTYFRTDKFTNAFQEIVDAYGVARYQEANPAVYSVVTFPFLFAVMFGDWGHGICLLLGALVLILREKRLSSQKLGSFMELAFGGRYVILLMAIFSIYCGLIYNEFFSVPFHIFGKSAYECRDKSCRYRGFCKAKKCNWRIHASQLPDGKTWQVKKMSKRHYCRSRSKMEKNCMANQYWVRDKVVPMLRENPNLGAGALVKKLQEKYLIQVSYCVAWKGKELALDELMGKWEDSFDHIYAFKAAIEKKSPGSVVEIQTEKVGEKIRFCKMFVAFKACIDGFLQGCRPYLGIDSTVLTGRWKGQLASAVAIDGHNWMFPVALGLFESESKDSWKWFMEKLQTAIGSPHGLVISTDAGKGIDSALTNAFNNGVEHRECVRHLFKNFQKRFHGEVFERNLWPAARAYRRTVHDKHYNIMKIASPAAIKWLEDTHKHLWARCYFSTASKCDYVTNNIAETFNSWIKDEKSLPPVELIDRIRQKILEKFFVRKNLADKLTGTILPSVMKQLHDAGRGLVGYVVHKGPDHTAEVSGVHKDLTPWRHTIDLVNRECSCKKWQLTGLPCTHALSVIGCFRNLKLEDYVDSYYSVEKFKTAYVGKIPTLTDKTEWEQPEVGYKVWPPILKRAAGRPRTRRFIGVEEGGSGKKRHKCKRCGQFGHQMRTCNEPVYDSDAPPPTAPKPKRVRQKKKKVVVVEDDPLSLPAPSSPV